MLIRHVFGCGSALQRHGRRECAEIAVDVRHYPPAGWPETRSIDWKSGRNFHRPPRMHDDEHATCLRVGCLVGALPVPGRVRIAAMSSSGRTDAALLRVVAVAPACGRSHVCRSSVRRGSGFAASAGGTTVTVFCYSAAGCRIDETGGIPCDMFDIDGFWRRRVRSPWL